MGRLLMALAVLVIAFGGLRASAEEEEGRGTVRCANLVYANNKTSKCYSDEFLREIERHTHVKTHERFTQANLESADLYGYAFAVMTGEGSFTLTDAQRDNMRNYLTNGGFIVASAGCSSGPWISSFRSEIAKVFPDVELRKLGFDHPIFHSVYDIDSLGGKGRSAMALEGLEIDGKIVLIFSPDGLNDTGKAGGDCCCCGGNEVKEARKMNVNLLAYALTH